MKDRLGEICKRHETNVANLCAIAAKADKSGIGDAAIEVRFSIRESGLAMLELARILSKLSEGCLVLSEDVHRAFSDDGEAIC